MDISSTDGVLVSNVKADECSRPTDTSAVTIEMFVSSGQKHLTGILISKKQLFCDSLKC